MRYRRLSYRYALTLTANHPGPLSGARPLEQLVVRLAQTFWRPPADVCESESAIDVTVELAGIDQDALDVMLFEDALVVEGVRRMSPAAGAVFHSAEIRQGPFRLELMLPAVIDPEQVDARYDQGLLRITLPKLERTNAGPGTSTRNHEARTR
jgi:HSP20 family protein